MSLKNSFVYSEADFSEAGFSDDEEFESSNPIILPDIRDKYESDTKCSNCLINFNIQGLAHTQKSKCLFCYRGTCIRCLAFHHKHPETQEKEKMCKKCKSERYKYKNIKTKIEAFRLEKAQLMLEIELATREKQEFINSRKAVQEKISQLNQNSALNSIELEIKFQKDQELQKNLEIRRNISVSTKFELEEKYNTLQMTLKNLQTEIKTLKKNLAEKDLNEKMLREKINQKKEQSLIILQKCKYKESETNQVIDSLMELKDEIENLEADLSDVLKKTADYEMKIYNLLKRNESNGSILTGLNERFSICKSVIVEEDLLTDEDRETLEKEQEKLRKYDEVIQALNTRISLLKRRSEDREQENRVENVQRSYRRPSELIGENDLSSNLGQNLNYRSTKGCSNCIIG